MEPRAHGGAGREADAGVRVLVLDCGQVTNPDWGAAKEAVAAAMGVPVEAAYRGHKAAWERARAAPTFVEYWQHAFDIAGVPPAQRTPERVAACEAAVGASLRRTFAPVVEVARRVRARGHVVGMISNHLVSPPLFEYCAAGAGLRELVSDGSLLLVSQAVGLAKPDAAIYSLFLARLRAGVLPGAEPEHLYFVDDKPRNVDAARALGWRGLVFNAEGAGGGPYIGGMPAEPGDFEAALDAHFGADAKEQEAAGS